MAGRERGRNAGESPKLNRTESFAFHAARSRRHCYARINQRPISPSNYRITRRRARIPSARGRPIIAILGETRDNGETLFRSCRGENARAACALSARDQHRALRQRRIRSFRSDYPRPEDTPTMEQTQTGSRVNQPLRQSITDPAASLSATARSKYSFGGENLGFANIYFRNSRDCVSRAYQSARTLRLTKA